MSFCFEGYLGTLLLTCKAIGLYPQAGHTAWVRSLNLGPLLGFLELQCLYLHSIEGNIPLAAGGQGAGVN